MMKETELTTTNVEEVNFKIKKVLAIDPGASCGFSIFKVDKVENRCEIVDYGFIDVETSSPYVGDWCIDLTKKIKALEEKSGPFDEIGVEDYFFSSRFKQGANVNPAYRTAIHIWARENGKHYEVLNISAWKVFVCGRTTPSREQKTKWGATSAKKAMVVEGLKERFGISFPEFCISKKTNRKIRFRYDIADAVAQGIYMVFLRFNIKDIIYPCEFISSVFDDEKEKIKNIDCNDKKQKATTRKKKTEKTINVVNSV